MDSRPEIDQVFQMQAQLDAAKSKQRELAKDYLRKAIVLFEFTPEDLFTPAQKFRDGSLAALRQIFDENPTITRKEFLARAQAANINPRTASTQYSRIRKDRNII